MKGLKGGHGLSFFAFSLCFLGAVAIPATGWAHETGHGHTQAEMSAHMQAMKRLKEKIPKGYRIMNRTPVTPTPRSLARGEEVFLKNCAVCHGKRGDGQGPAAAGMDPAPANFLDLDHSATYGPGEKYWLIGNGSEELGMPAFPQLSPTDRWHVVNHILFLQKKERAGNDDQGP